MKCHGDGAFVVAEEHGRESLSEAEVTKKEAQIECFIGALRKGVERKRGGKARRGEFIEFLTG